MTRRTDIRRKHSLGRPLMAVLFTAGLFSAAGLLGASPAQAKQADHQHHLQHGAQNSSGKHAAKHVQADKHAQAGKRHIVAKAEHKDRHGHHVTVASIHHAPTPHFNCVQYVQLTTKVGLHGNAWEWWENAEGMFPRGEMPKPGAIMVFSKTGNLPYGHVAVVRQVQNNRTILIDHANWSPVRGRRGQVEKGVRVIDVSAANDWSEVRVWYGPTKDIGSTVYPLNGFIYTHRDVQHHLR